MDEAIGVGWGVVTRRCDARMDFEPVVPMDGFDRDDSAAHVVSMAPNEREEHIHTTFSLDPEIV
ncbi:hypothetical protein [Halopenitus sp. POP-27]|uniref:hypothetical protein n=1 Tax=Halopenitus sp. POP-27 TaxID=2994425 RepID=UPI0024684B63|nr:hypothetical protein [Halopenitus sp. POP-27]